VVTKEMKEKILAEYLKQVKKDLEQEFKIKGDEG